MSSGPMIPLARPWFGAEELEAVQAPIRSGWVTQGPEVAAFESEFAAAVGAPHACAVSSCTTALHLALLAAGVGRGDEVITVSHSYIATANAIRYCEALPVFIDIEPEGFNMDPTQIEANITERTRAILCVHQVGVPCDLAAILEIARKHGLPVIEDAACAIGSEILWNGRWERIGAPHADIACFSFHPRKVITTGDGGMLTTRDPEVDARFRLWRQHGMRISDVTRHSSPTVLFEDYPTLGYNYRMTDLQASLGRVQLRRLEEIIQRRRSLADRYHDALASLDGVTPPREPEGTRTNWQTYLIRLADDIPQKDFMQRMLDSGVSTRRGVMCAHREPAYAVDGVPLSLPRSESAQDHTVAIPLYPEMTEDQQDRVLASIRSARR